MLTLSTILVPATLHIDLGAAAIVHADRYFHHSCPPIKSIREEHHEVYVDSHSIQISPLLSFKVRISLCSPFNSSALSPWLQWVGCHVLDGGRLNLWVTRNPSVTRQARAQVPFFTCGCRCGCRFAQPFSWQSGFCSTCTVAIPWCINLEVRFEVRI